MRPGTQRAYRNVTQQRLADWLPLPISQITQRMVDDRHRYITIDGGKWKASKAQANQTMRILKALLNFANTHYERNDGQPTLPVNPVDTLTQTRSWHRQPVRQGIVPDYKLADFHRALRHPTIKDYLLLLTGLRRMEAMTLRWSDVDIESRTLTIPATRSKNHQEHRLPIGTFLLDLLSKRKASSQSDYVFPGTGIMPFVTSYADVQIQLALI